MNLRQLRYLVATAEHGTMTAAARAEHVAQPVVSRAVRALERELGIALFEPAGRRVALTAHGGEVVGAARRVLAEIEAIEQVGARATDPALLVIATTPTLEQLFTRRLLPALYTERPDARVHVVRAPSREEVAALVRDGGAEVGLTDLPAPGSPEASVLEATVIGAQEVVLVSPSGAALPDPTPVGMLDGMRLVLPSEGTYRRDEFEGLFRAVGVSPVAAVETDERSSWVAAASAGIGSFLWYRSSAEAVEDQGIELRSFEPALRRELALVHRPGELGAVARALVGVALALGLGE